MQSGQVSVGTNPTVVVPTSSAHRGGTLRNAGTVSAFLGGSAVTTSTGLELPAGASIPVGLDGGEALYGIVASGTCRVDFIANG